MAIYGNLRDYQFADNAEDIRGAEVFSTDNEKLGTVADVIFDSSSGDLQYFVIETGGWLSTDRFLVPARQVMSNVEGEDHFRVNLTKEQVKRFPEYREDVLESDERWADYERRYVESYDWSETGGVLHREGTTHTITPTAEELPAKGHSSVNPMAATPRRIAQDQPRFGATSDNEDPAHTGHTGAGPAPASGRFREGTYDPHRPVIDPIEPENNPLLVGDEAEMERTESEPSTMSRSEFAKDGTLRSEYDAPREDEFISQQPRATYAGNEPGTGKYGYATDARRFREFQERVRREREQIVNRRRGDQAA